MTIKQLMELLDASKRTVQRRLHLWQALTSFNKNGRYYSLPDVPEFDSFGIWRFRRVYFSRYGNLTRTVVGLVLDSVGGLDATELTQRLGLNAHSFLSRLAQHPEIDREKIEGRFVYFSADPERRESQLCRRHEWSRRSQLPSPTQVVTILVEAIKRPESDPETLATRLRRQGQDISAEQVRNLFEYHGLVVKKTPPSDSSDV